MGEGRSVKREEEENVRVACCCHRLRCHSHILFVSQVVANLQSIDFVVSSCRSFCSSLVCLASIGLRLSNTELHCLEL